MDSYTADSSHRGRRLLGTTMMVVGILGILAAIFSALFASFVVGRVNDNLTASIEVTIDGVDAARDSVDVFGVVVRTLRTESETVASVVNSAADTVEETRDVADAIVEIAGDDLPDVLESLADFFPAIETAAASIDNFLEALSELPLTADYVAEDSLAQAVHGMQDEIGQLAGTLREGGAELEDAAATLAGYPADLRSIAVTIEELDDELAAAENLVAEYDTTLLEVRGVADAALGDAKSGEDWAVAALVTVSVIFGLGQIVPIWLGHRLRTTPGLPPAANLDAAAARG